jgi:hypothetical protein
VAGSQDALLPAALRAHRCDEAIQHPANFFYGCLIPFIVLRREKSHALCDFKLNLDFSLRPKCNIEMIQKYGLALAPFSLADIRRDGNARTPNTQSSALRL